MMMTRNSRGRAIGPCLIAMMLVLAFGTLSYAQGGRYAVNPWSFGVHGDTQWTVDGNLEDNPNYVSAAVIRALNERFLAHNVKFVVQVGDLSDRAGDAALATRAELAQTLYDHGIGFFPLRGNHETYGWMYFLDPANDLNIPAFKNNFPQTQGLSNTFGATNFSSPSSTGDILNGLSYSFDYGSADNNARFVIVDVEGTKISAKTPDPHPLYGPGAFYIFWTVYKHTADLAGTTGAYDADGNWVKVDTIIPAGTYFRISGGKPCTDFYGYDNGTITKYNTKGNIYPVAENLYYISATVSGEYWPGSQQEWISGRLDSSTRGSEHAFVFSHRPLIGGNHVDCFFGKDPSVTVDAQNDFYASLANNGVKYMISGHDHFHNRALLSSPDGSSKVEQLISIGASTKFYGPASINSFPVGVKDREIEISQELNNM